MIATRWSLLEEWLCKWLAFMSGGDEPQMRVLMAQMTASSTIASLRLLMKQRSGASLADAGYTELFSRLEAARNNRNAWVHGLWMPTDNPAIANVQTVRWGRKIPLQEEDISLSQLDELAREIAVLIGQVIHTLDQAGPIHKQRDVDVGHGR